MISDTVVEKPGFMWTCGNLTAYIAGSTLVAMEDPGMAGPGIYRPDPSEGITRPEDAPTATDSLQLSRRQTTIPVLVVGTKPIATSASNARCMIWATSTPGCPRDLVITYSQHYCTKCRKYFNAGPVRSGATGQSVHPPRDRSGGTARGRGRLALPPGELAPVARPPRLCALCDHPELGRGGGKKGAGAHGHRLP